MPRSGHGWFVEGLVNLASFTSLVVVSQPQALHMWRSFPEGRRYREGVSR